MHIHQPEANQAPVLSGRARRVAKPVLFDANDRTVQPNRMATAEQLASVSYLHLDGPGLEDAISNGALSSPRLRYYIARSCLSREPDARQMFMAVIPRRLVSARQLPSYHRGLNVPIALAELQPSTGYSGYMTLCSITVDPAFRGAGVSKGLLAEVISYLKANQLKLTRTRPGRYCYPGFTDLVGEQLDAAGIEWKRRTSSYEF